MDNSTKIFELNINYVYEELVSEFIQNRGFCTDLTYNLINWKYAIDLAKCMLMKV